MARLIYDPAAKFEIREAAAYYEESREGLGKEFLVTVEAAVQQLVSHPLLSRRIRGRFRRWLVPRFPYGIIYCVEGDAIYIAAVMHLHRKPGYWKNRRIE
jgi:plasmid stabilization system protein ParE